MKRVIRRKKITYEMMMSYGFFIVLIAAFLFSLHPDRSFSDAENRVLRTSPQFHIESFIDRRFQEQFTEYKSDQFFMRDSWIHMKSRLDIMLGKKRLNGVYLGKGDQLFEDFTPSVSDEELASVINRFADTYPQLDIMFLLAPNPISIWQDRLPASAPVRDQKAHIEELRGLLNETVKWVDAYSALEQHKEEDIYYRSDHHWTSLGAYYAFYAYADIAGIEVKEEDWKRLLVSDTFHGTLTGKSGYTSRSSDELYVYVPTDTSLQYIVQYIDEQEKSTSVYKTENLNKHDQYSVFLNGNHPLIEIDTTSSVDKHLLVIKDSYANSMIPFLLPYYNRITVVDPRYYNEDLGLLIKESGITDVLFLYNANTLFQDTSLSMMINE